MMQLNRIVGVVGMMFGGCTSCEQVNVTLELAEQEVKALPVLQSGKPLVATVSTPLPDSHGRFFVKVTIEGTHTVNLSDLRYDVQLAGSALEIKQVRNKSSRGDVESPNLPGDGDVVDGDVLELWWRARALSNLSLAVDSVVRSSIALDWVETGVGGQSGTATLDITESVVRAVADTGAFRAAAASEFSAVSGDAKAEVRGLFDNQAGLLVDVKSAAAKVVFYGASDVDLGVALFTADDLARQVGSVEAGSVMHDQQLVLYSAASPRGNAPEPSASGTAVRTGNLGSGKAVAVFDIAYETSEAPGLQRSEVVTAFDL